MSHPQTNVLDAAKHHYSKINSCVSLSTDHDLNFERKLCPNNREPFVSDMLPATFNTVLPPTLSDLMLNVFDVTTDPSAILYFCYPIKSLSSIVLVLISVSTTSAGIETSEAPLRESANRKTAFRRPLHSLVGFVLSQRCDL